LWAAAAEQGTGPDGAEEDSQTGWTTDSWTGWTTNSWTGWTGSWTGDDAAEQGNWATEAPTGGQEPCEVPWKSTNATGSGVPASSRKGGRASSTAAPQWSRRTRMRINVNSTSGSGGAGEMGQAGWAPSTPPWTQCTGTLANPNSSSSSSASPGASSGVLVSSREQLVQARKGTGATSTGGHAGPGVLLPMVSKCPPPHPPWASSQRRGRGPCAHEMCLWCNLVVKLMCNALHLAVQLPAATAAVQALASWHLEHP